MRKIDIFRKKHPKFVYSNCEIRHKNKTLDIVFRFKLEPGISFRSSIRIDGVSKARLQKIGETELYNLAFHAGLAEMPSYWKTACPPEISIEAGYLDRDQIRWWKDLLIKGMGQFFYENKINFRQNNFLTITNRPMERSMGLNVGANLFLGNFRNRYLVSLAGGRDSIVGLEFLKNRGKEINAFMLNPTAEARSVATIAGIRNPIVVERKIDPLLFKLNKRGYLNGHTPFTATLSFLSVLCAVIFDYRHVVFSNEKSANEGNLKYLGQVINHQYSKSSAFEEKFRHYTKKYLADSLDYFSLLRPYSDLEISKMFSRYPEYFRAFSSCNAGRHLGKKWCGACPKCLFVYATLYPYLQRSDLCKIFGRDLFDKKELLPIMKGLVDPKVPKPFECVGTKKESRRAFELSLIKARRAGKAPYLLDRL